MYKKKKVADVEGSLRGSTDAMDEEMDFKNIMKDIELFSRLLTCDMERKKGNEEQESNCSGWEGNHGDSAKRSFGRCKPVDRVLKASEGHFRNGVLAVKHLLRLTTSSRDSDSSIHVVTKGKKKGGGKKNRGTKGGSKKHH